MEAKNTEWRPGPTVCRCCLAEGCYKDISTEYFWMGKREVYAEMLLDTLNVTIAYSQSGGPNSNSRLICEPCISRLRDACDFKKQVLECEKTFMQHLDPSSSSVEPVLETETPLEILDSDVKLERVKLEKPISDDEFDDDRDFDADDNDDDMDDEPLTKLASRLPKKESVDLMDLLDNTKAAEKRKSSTKIKVTKKPKILKIDIMKPSPSKQTPKPEKKKKGRRDLSDEVPKMGESQPQNSKKQKYKRSARAEARIITKKNATAILDCWSLCPFRWKKNRFKCAYCEENFTDCSQLRDHVRICSTQHSTKDIYRKFKEMTLINVDVTEATCCFCSVPLTDLAQIRDHVIQHGLDFDVNHPDGVLPFCLDKQSWKCKICSKIFNNFLKLYEHMNIHYQHYICDICGKGYMSAPRLRKHHEVHISGSFPCNDCGRIFTMRAARDSHKATAHAKGPRYECPHCDKRFDGYYDRMKHMITAHSEKEVSYNCSHCELSFKTSGKRAVHVRSVHFPLQLNFGCNYCEWQFKTNYELKRHMVRHTGEKRFYCSICGKSFPRNNGLTTHLKSHQQVNCKWVAICT